MSKLTGKVAIVTGGSRGIGAAISRKLAAEGAKIVVNYTKNADAANRVAQAIVESGGEARAAQADISDSVQGKWLVAETVAYFGYLDILVNNAALSGNGMRPLTSIDEAHYDSLFNLNVRGLLFLTQVAAQVMRDGGRIINISSGAAVVSPPGMAVYSASKAAVEALTKSIASELGPRQITVNVVSPGVTETDMLHETLSPEMCKAMIRQTPLGRLGQPEDIAEAVAFLVSDEARWITGQVIHASGGLR